MKTLLIVKAELIKPVSFAGKTVPVGTKLVVDPDMGVGYFEDDHFDLDQDEYKVLNQN